MAIISGKTYKRQDLLRRVGDISQIGGVRRIELADGRERGVRAVEFNTGTGLNFTVLLDRGMDICSADYCGKSLCWHSPTGVAHPSYYEPEGIGWLRSFFGGLLTTCGLHYMGAPDIDKGKALGLHGRISNTAASNIQADGQWEGDDYIMTVSGSMRETAVFLENLVLRRKIRAKLGEKRFFIDDIVENCGFTQVEHMILYHINGGFPVIDEGSEMVAPFVKTEPRDDEAYKYMENFSKFHIPSSGFKERVYYHELAEDEKGYTCGALINRQLELGFYVKYLRVQLPVLVEWKMNGEGVYTVGMEPSTNRAGGRSQERKDGKLIMLEPGEKRSYNLEIGVLSGREEIEEFDDKCRRLITT